jgi:hypothetical protein
MVGPLIDKLLRWQPDVIAVEALPGDTIAALKTRSDDFAELMQPFTKSTVEAGELAATALKLDASASRHELRQTVTAGTTGSTDRVRLALLFAAAYDYPSAVLQWSYLSPPERARAKLPDPLRTRLDQSLSGNNEIYAIAVPLARRLGLDRLALVDDFFGEEAYATRVDAFVEEVERSPQVKELSSAPFYVESTERLQATCGAPEKLSAHYEWMNSLQYGKQDAALQWGVWFRTRFESGLDRARYAGWEARNLGIAAHVRKETSLHPGKRVLVIYGAAHKPFLDLYLSQLGDVDVVQLGDLDPKGRTITQ